MAKIISIINHKGGVGKTTTSVNLGSALALLGRRILLIDLDPQANLTYHLGIDEALGVTIYDSLTGRGKLPILKLKNLSVVPSNIDLSAVEVELISKVGREYILKRLIEPVKLNYDYIIIDCPPSLGLLTINALAFTDEVIIPVEPAFFAVKGMMKLLEIIEDIKKNDINSKMKIKALITKVDKRKNLHNVIKEEIKEYFKGEYYNTIIRTNVSLEEAQTNGLDIFSYAPNSNGATDYMNLANEVL